jgi:4'-phosphopantetheinyl transferase
MTVHVQSELKFEFRSCDAGENDSFHASLPRDEVHVWLAPLPAAAADIPLLSILLSSDEKERAERFRLKKHRDTFIFTRGTLRTLLANYLGVPPAGLHFAYAAHGKPFLAFSQTAPTLAFNLSHTEGMAAFAFTRDRKLGIDVEKVRSDFEVEPIAERFFSLAELLALRNVPAEHRHEAFFRSWTCKEAYIKALGEGFSHPLHQFDVSASHAEPAALLHTRPDPAEAQRWCLQDVPLPPGHVAALAVEAHPTPPSSP